MMIAGPDWLTASGCTHASSVIALLFEHACMILLTGPLDMMRVGAVISMPPPSSQFTAAGFSVIVRLAGAPTPLTSRMVVSPVTPSNL